MGFKGAYAIEELGGSTVNEIADGRVKPLPPRAKELMNVFKTKEGPEERHYAWYNAPKKMVEKVKVV